jgi:hypothetical protein
MIDGDKKMLENMEDNEVKPDEHDVMRNDTATGVKWYHAGRLQDNAIDYMPVKADYDTEIIV